MPKPNMADHILYGKNGEDIAAHHLQKKGYNIKSRNFRYGKAEIDIIAIQDKVLVFVEVKARARTLFGNPEEAVGSDKKKMILKAAENYIHENNWLGDIRFDIISIVNQDQIDHFEDAF